MIKKIILFILMAVYLTSCQNDINTIYEIDTPKNGVKSTIIGEASGVEKEILINIYAHHLGGYTESRDLNTRAQSDFSLTPYTYKNDTVFYIAQYQEGWELYSASLSMPMIILSSEKGILDMDDKNMPEALRDIIDDNAEAIYESKLKERDYIDESWGAIALSEEEIGKENIMVLNENGLYSIYDTGDLPPGHWEVVGSSEVSSETTTTPKLTRTLWGQDAPWNIYANKIVSTDGKVESAPAGCVPVAVAQYIYYTHVKDGEPFIGARKAMEISNSDGSSRFNYIYSEYGIQWSGIALNASAQDTKTSALLIGYVGASMNAEYGSDGTSVKEESMIQFLSSIFKRDFTRLDFNRSKVVSAIESDYPVITTAYSDKNSNGQSIDAVGHAFLIDQYQKTIKTMRYEYVWVRDPLPPGTVDRWIADQKDKDGNIIKYAYTTTMDRTGLYSDRISMNWGWGGSWNHIYYTLTSDWSAGGYIFNMSHRIFLPNQ